jgi:hypothetical protein
MADADVTAEPEHFPAFSAAEFDRCEAAVWALMAQRDLDVVVLYGNGASHSEVPTQDLLSGVRFGEMLRIRTDGVERSPEAPREALVCG